MELDLDNAESIIGWSNRKLEGLPMMTATMMVVLCALRDSKNAGYPFVALKMNKRTSRSLIDRDWIIKSNGLDGVRYKITGRGLNALETYSCPLRRRQDGLCPDCGERERMVGSTGFVYGYCKPCNRKRANDKYNEKGNQLNPDGLCAKCKKRQRHVYPSGYTIPYCKYCRKRMRKSEKRRKMKRLLARINNGEFIPCIRCKTCPRYHSEKTVYDYCHSCYREQQNDYVIRKQSESIRAKYADVFERVD